jgi:surface protein
MSCPVDIGGSCGGDCKPWDTLFVSKSECCEKKLKIIGVPIYEQQPFRDSCLASCHSPTPAHNNTSSKNPSTNPSSNPSEINITSIEQSTNPSSFPSSNSNSSPFSNHCFSNREDLISAVNAYTNTDPATAATAKLQFGSIGLWCTKLVTDMSFLFNEIGFFNEDINGWEVGQVTNMDSMFFFAPRFNQQLNGWNVSRVTNMHNMFSNAAAFNQPLNRWDVNSVTTMHNMFTNAEAFNQPLNGWDVSSVTTMQGMFMMFSSAFGQPKFNQPLNGWQVGKVTDMGGMFSHCSKFNQDLCPWGSKMMFSTVNVDNMFGGSGCPNMVKPTGPSGPWCAVTNCTA